MNQAVDPRGETIVGYRTLLREVNEHVRKLAEGIDYGPLEMLCECDLAACREPIRITRDEYDAVRAEPRCFLLKPGHERPDETIVQRTPRFVVVEGRKEER